MAPSGNAEAGAPFGQHRASNGLNPSTLRSRMKKLRIRRSIDVVSK